MGELTKVKEEILERYYRNNAKKMRKVVDKMLVEFGWITDPDHFYSLANEVFTIALRDYDEQGGFDYFFRDRLSNKVKSEITRMNRKKRTADRNALSISTVINEEENLTFEDMISNDYDTERDALREDDINDVKMQEYLGHLSKTQQKIVYLITRGYSPSEIRDITGLSVHEYSDNMINIKALRNLSIFFKD